MFIGQDALNAVIKDDWTAYYLTDPNEGPPPELNEVLPPEPEDLYLAASMDYQVVEMKDAGPPPETAPSTSTALVMRTDPPPSPKRDLDRTLDLQINTLASSLGNANLNDWVVLNNKGDELITKKLESLSVNNNGDNDVRELEFKQLLEISTAYARDGKSDRSKVVYQRYQEMYLTYLKLYDLDAMNEASLKTFLVVLHHKYSGSTMWTIYSCVNAWYKSTHRMDLKNGLWLRTS